MKTNQLQIIVVALMRTILCKAEVLIKRLSPQNSHTKGSGHFDQGMYFSLSCPLSCEVLKLLWIPCRSLQKYINLEILQSAVARRWWQEGSNGHSHITVIQSGMAKGDHSIRPVSMHQGELGIRAKVSECEQYHKLLGVRKFLDNKLSM